MEFTSAPRRVTANADGLPFLEFAAESTFTCLRGRKWLEARVRQLNPRAAVHNPWQSPSWGPCRVSCRKVLEVMMEALDAFHLNFGDQ